ADLANVFRRVLEDDFARGRYVIGNGVNSTLAELTEAAAAAVGAPGAVSSSEQEARGRLGDNFAEVLLLDPEAAVYTSILYLLDGTSQEEAERIAWGVLANPLIHDVEIRSWTEWESSPPDLTVPRVDGHERPPVERAPRVGRARVRPNADPRSSGGRRRSRGGRRPGAVACPQRGQLGQSAHRIALVHLIGVAATR
ncbi:hypothetical protein B4Q13_21635, partial [Lacticaseibacillus rhamnosus]